MARRHESVSRPLPLWTTADSVEHLLKSVIVPQDKDPVFRHIIIPRQPCGKTGIGDNEIIGPAAYPAVFQIEDMPSYPAVSVKRRDEIQAIYRDDSRPGISSEPAGKIARQPEIDIRRTAGHIRPHRMPCTGNGPGYMKRQRATRKDIISFPVVLISSKQCRDSPCICITLNLTLRATVRQGLQGPADMQGRPAVRLEHSRNVSCNLHYSVTRTLNMAL